LTGEAGVLVQPREQTLDIWRSVVAYSYRDGRWRWGGRSGSNSISDAEQLLCVLYPATSVAALRLDRPDETARDVLDSLRGLGDDFQIIQLIVGTLTEYMERHSEDGRPIFSGGGYVASETPEGWATEEQQRLEVLDSFAISVTLGLSTLGFLQVLRPGIRGQSLLRQIDHLRDLTSLRLTAAMTGLLRSFSVRTFTHTDLHGRNLCTMVNQGAEPERVVAERLARSLSDIRARLREEVSTGSGPVADELGDPSRLFECGWSWGVVDGAAEVEFVPDMIAQRSGVADNRPYLYFTSVALDRIENLFTARTRILGLLDETQQRLAQALQLRGELCLEFWKRAAMFDATHWPVEDVPWQTTDGVFSEYFTLFVASMAVQREAAGGQGVRSGRALSQQGIVRLGALLGELASRGRITRRALLDDPALELHLPGIRLRLDGNERIGARLTWPVSNYSILLFKLAVRVADLASDVGDRDSLSRLADDIWDHLRGRRLQLGFGDGLWDEPGGVLPVPGAQFSEPSWQHTLGIVECLVEASWSVEAPPRASGFLRESALEYLVEAEHLLDQERLLGTPQAGHGMHVTFDRVVARLDRARALLDQRPGTSVVLAQDVLRDLDEIAMARTGPSRFGG
jgi:hypothetical protein